MAVDQKDPRIQEYLRQQEQEKGKKKEKPRKKAPKGGASTADSGKSQHRLFKKTRAGTVLTRDEVKAIKAGRKKLRGEMRERGLKGKADFELTASSLGLYFDKRNRGFLIWFARHWLGSLLALLGILLLTLMLFSSVSHARGYFTINLTDGMFRKGFTLSETRGFENPTTQLFATAAEGVPCISISQIPTNVDEIDGQHNDAYFAYTWYLRNESETEVDFDWELNLSAESQGLSSAMWVLLFEDGQLRIYAKANGETGQAEALPAFGVEDRGYRFLPIRALAPESDQFQVVKESGSASWWRVVPEPFFTDNIVASGGQTEVAPQQVHKYTVVLWMEGDDPDCTDALINGHAGVSMKYRLVGEADGGSGTDGVSWADLWDDLRFW